MKKILSILLMIVSCTFVSSCEQRETAHSSNPYIESTSKNEEKYDMNKLRITVGNKYLIATLENNLATKALIDLIKNKPLSINMNDYGGFEKVGLIGTSLPTNDTYITTITGDIMLYQGNSMVIFYESNSWSYTRLGKIENVTKDYLLEVLGTGNVEVELSIIKGE